MVATSFIGLHFPQPSYAACPQMTQAGAESVGAFALASVRTKVGSAVYRQSARQRAAISEGPGLAKLLQISSEDQALAANRREAFLGKHSRLAGG